MTYRGFDAELLEQLDDSHRTYLLQHVLRAIEPASMLSKHVSSAGGLVVELPRLAAAEHGHALRGQPHERLLGRLREHTSRAVGEVAAWWPSAGAPEEFLRREFPVVWDHDPGWPRLVRFADELACLVATTGRDPASLERDLTHVARRGGDAAAFLSALLPAFQDYSVACVVRGTDALDDLALFSPSARQEPLKHAHRMRCGPATHRLRAFLSEVPLSGASCVVIISVDAPDKPSAAGWPQVAHRAARPVRRRPSAADPRAAPGVPRHTFGRAGHAAVRRARGHRVARPAAGVTRA